MWYRIPYFLILTILGVFITPLITLPLAVFYALRWYAIELVLLGYIFDTYFGHVANWPYYTLTLAALVLISEFAKKYLMLHSEAR